MPRELQGKKVLVTREEAGSRLFKRLLEEEDAQAYVFPLIERVCRPLPEGRERVDYEWVFFTSVKGVECFLSSNVLGEIGGCLRFAVIGPKTGFALERAGFRVDFMPSVYEARVMGEEFFRRYDVSGRILLVQGNRALGVLEEACVSWRVGYDCLVVYETCLVRDGRCGLWDVLERVRMDFLTFTSPSIVRAFMLGVRGHEEEGLFKRLPTICIGPTTAEAAFRAGFVSVRYPKSYTIEGMIDVMKGWENEWK